MFPKNFRNNSNKCLKFFEKIFEIFTKESQGIPNNIGIRKGFLTFL